MRKFLALAACLFVPLAANAAPLLDDGFDQGFPNITLPGNTPYNPETVALGQNFLGYRGVSGANFNGATGESLQITGGSGQLAAASSGTSSGLMELSYHEFPNGSSDLSGVASVTFYIVSSSSELSVSLGLYSQSYGHLSGVGFTLPVGFTGAKTVWLSQLTGDPLVANDVNSLFLDFQLSPGGSVVLDRLTVDPVPEPTTILVLGLGGFAVLRKGKAAAR